MCIVSHEPIVTVGHCIGRVEVNEISFLGVMDRGFKVTFSEDVPLEGAASLFNVCCVTRSDVTTAPIWDVEVTFGILPVDSVER